MPKLTLEKDLNARNYPGLSFTNGDMEIDEGGKTVFVSGLEKLFQKIAIEVTMPYDALTDRGSNVLEVLENSTNYYEEAETLLRDELYSAVARIQKRQSEKTPPEERITRILEVQVVRNEDDPTDYNFLIHVENLVGETGTVTGISLEDPFSYSFVYSTYRGGDS